MAINTSALDDLAGRSSEVVPLRYNARAGLLNEVSRQTYDVLYKSLREAILNGSDAGASRVEVDLSNIKSHGSLSVHDDGHGMSLDEFCRDFMGVGGSAKFDSDDQYGRIGIGSLALLQYATNAVVETKVRGAKVFTRANLSHVRDLTAAERATNLNDLDAGVAAEIAYDGDPEDHFTTVRLTGVSDEIAVLGSDPTRCYALVDRLRRVLPLPWAEPRVHSALSAAAPDVTQAIVDHVSDWNSSVVVHTHWERDIALTWRAFGEDPAGSETWAGRVSPFIKKLRVLDRQGQREIMVAGYLLNQSRPSANWMGITARVQNVAVEENSFFDVTSDPGFRKYISGEVWIFGEIDRQRLINIDRASFNRGSDDFKVIQRYLAAEITSFKTSAVQRPQRTKAEVRRLLEHRRATISGLVEVSGLAAQRYDLDQMPASEPGRSLNGPHVTLEEELGRLSVNVAIHEQAGDSCYSISVQENGDGVSVEISPNFANPAVVVGGKEYAIHFSRGIPEGPPIVIRNRPRRIIVNLDHETHVGQDQDARVRLGLALELSYLLSAESSSSVMYESLMSLLSHGSGD
jgi:hypothetical protein